MRLLSIIVLVGLAALCGYAIDAADHARTTVATAVKR